MRSQSAVRETPPTSRLALPNKSLFSAHLLISPAHQSVSSTHRLYSTAHHTIIIDKGHRATGYRKKNLNLNCEWITSITNITSLSISRYGTRWLYYDYYHYNYRGRYYDFDHYRVLFPLPPCPIFRYVCLSKMSSFILCLLFIVWLHQIFYIYI